MTFPLGPVWPIGQRPEVLRDTATPGEGHMAIGANITVIVYLTKRS